MPRPTLIRPTALTLAEAALTLRDAMRDKSYRMTPLGVIVARYVRWLRNEWGATPATVRDYEAVLARMALTLADREPLDVTVDDLRDVIDLWADREARTRAKVTSIIRSFWAWAEAVSLYTSDAADD
jgi:site-specific recombinase XerD